MSIEAIREAATTAKGLVGGNIVIADIERMKGSFRKEYRGLVITGEFWDLNDYKTLFGRIHPSEVMTWPRNICVAWKQYGQRKVEFASEWDDGADGMHQRIWEALDKAQIVVGHNMRGFDRKKLNGAFWLNGLWPPSPYKVIDTLTVARSELGQESNTLDSLLTRAGLNGKTDRYDVEMARAALAGDVKAQRKLKAYNVGDIHASEALYDSLRPWTKNHPHVNAATDPDEITCPNCESDNLTANGTTAGPSGRVVYKLWRCQDCGTNVSDTRQHAKTARTKSVI